jgi:trehalose-6-phosphatase
MNDNSNYIVIQTVRGFKLYYQGTNNWHSNRVYAKYFTEEKAKEIVELLTSRYKDNVAVYSFEKVN